MDTVDDCLPSGGEGRGEDGPVEAAVAGRGGLLPSSVVARVAWALGWLLAAAFFVWAFWEVANAAAGLIFDAFEGAGVKGDAFVLYATLTSHGFAAALAALCWWSMRRHSHIYGARGTVGRREVARGMVTGLLAGLSLQVVCFVLISMALRFAPELIEAYRDHMAYPIYEVSAVGSLLFSAVLAPITEEFLCRGVVMELALRAVFPRHRLAKGAAAGARAPSPSEAEGEGSASAAASTLLFWVANVAQAFLFGASHGNFVQGAYSMFSGLLAGWMTWHFKSMLPAFALHVSFNLGDYVFDWFLEGFIATGSPLFIGGIAVMFSAGLADVMLMVEKER